MAECSLKSWPPEAEAEGGAGKAFLPEVSCPALQALPEKK